MPLPSELVFIIGGHVRLDTLIRLLHITHHPMLKKIVERRPIEVVTNDKSSSLVFITVEECKPTWTEYHGAMALGKNKYIQRLTEKDFFYPLISALRTLISHWPDITCYRILYLNDTNELRMAKYNRNTCCSDELLQRDVRWARHSIVDKEVPKGRYAIYKESNIFIRTSRDTLWHSDDLGKKWQEIKYIPDHITDICYFKRCGDKHLVLLSDEKLYIDETLRDTDVLGVIPYEQYLFYFKRNGQIVRWDKHGTITYDRDLLVIPYLNSYLIVRMHFYDDSQGSLDVQGYHPSELVKYLKKRDHVSLKFVNGICSGPEYTWGEW